jgi:hypothetical protein
MATFKLNQRVRVVGMPRSSKMLHNLGATGREATVVVIAPHPGLRTDGINYGIQIDGWPCDGPYGDWWGVRACDIAPLTPPKQVTRDEREEIKA